MQKDVIDFATIAYAVPNYYVAKNARLMVFYNKIYNAKNTAKLIPKIATRKHI